jgi:hypothetical protein
VCYNPASTKLVALSKGKAIVKRKLTDYLDMMRAKDIVKATEEAKIQSLLLLEEQSITLLALLFADVEVAHISRGHSRQ